MIVGVCAGQLCCTRERSGGRAGRAGRPAASGALPWLPGHKEGFDVSACLCLCLLPLLYLTCFPDGRGTDLARALSCWVEIRLLVEVPLVYELCLIVPLSVWIHPCWTSFHCSSPRRLCTPPAAVLPVPEGIPGVEQEVSHPCPQPLQPTCLPSPAGHLAGSQPVFFFPTDFEASFIRLLDKITNGSRIEINQTGK